MKKVDFENDTITKNIIQTANHHSSGVEKNGDTAIACAIIMKICEIKFALSVERNPYGNLF